ncbi:MAG: 50S ribosomal protein L29 [Tepidisphaeraceae bacterium]|jgi:large subunit ribosomal protein L29
MKTKEMRDKETDHLRLELAEQQKHLFTLRSQAVTEKLEDPSQLGKARRVIAQLKTILRQREIEAQKSKAAGTQPAKS